MTRLIARLDIKGRNLIKGIHLEGVRVVGEPNFYAKKYYTQGIDEIIFMDSVASLYGRNHLGEIIKEAVKGIFVPMTVGGGIRTVEDAGNVLRSGADKVAVNTAAVSNPLLITDIAKRFGSQCMVLSIEAKQISPGLWEALTNNGRDRTGLDVIAWAKLGAQMGAGEILLTSVDCEGTRKGFDNALISAVSQAVDIPVIASGGMGRPDDLVAAVNHGADGIAMAGILHHGLASVDVIRASAETARIHVRRF